MSLSILSGVKNKMVATQVFVFFVFISFVLVESVALIARNAGHECQAHPIGMSLHNAVLSLNRFLGFMVGPLLGFLIDNGVDRLSVFSLGIISCVIGSIGLIISMQLWGGVVQRFCIVIRSVKKNGYSIGGWFAGADPDKKMHLDKTLSNKNLFYASMIITGLTLPVPFIINTLALGYFEYRSSILQLTGLVSGVGSLLLNFYANPQLAILEQRKNVGGAYFSLHLGKICGLGFISPSLIFLSYVM